MMKRFLQIANLIVLLFTIWVNYYINSGSTGVSMKAISDQFLNLFTPAGYAFSIWGVIYLMLLAFSVYQLSDLFNKKVNTDFVLDVSGWFILANLANAAWVVVFTNGQVGLSVLIMLVLFASLLKIVLNLNMERTDPFFVYILLVWWPVSAYFGWINVAMIANISTWLTALGWNGSPLTPTIWAILMLLVAGSIFITMVWKRNMREYASAGVWGVVAVGVKNLNSNDAVAYTAFTVAVLVLINVMAHGYKNRSMGPIRKWRPVQ